MGDKVQILCVLHIYVKMASDTALQNSVPRSEMITSGQPYLVNSTYSSFAIVVFFVMDWNKFWPFSEEITNGKNVLVTLRFYHGNQIYTYLA